MQSEKVTSFTQKALLNNVALDWLCPPDREKKRIHQTTNSLVQTLLSPEAFSSKPINSKLHLAGKPFRVVARAIYGLVVMRYVSPLGVVTRGSIIAFRFTAHKVLRNEKTQAEWDKVKKLSIPLFEDLATFILGLCTVLMAQLFLKSINIVLFGPLNGIPVYYRDWIHEIYLLQNTNTKAKKIFHLFICGCFSLTPIFAAGAFRPSRTYPPLSTMKRDGREMYLCLAMRDKLGLVNENGKLLHFSNNDSCEELPAVISSAELNLIDKVREANTWRSNNRFSALIPFSYPFNGNKIARLMERDIEEYRLNDAQQTQLFKIVEDLRDIQFKIDTLRDFYVTSKKVEFPSIFSFYGDLFELLDKISQTEKPMIRAPNSFISEGDYKLRFQNPNHNPQSSKPAAKPLMNFYTGLELQAIDPTTVPQISKPLNVKDHDMLYQWFRYQLGVNKWYALNNGNPKDWLPLFDLNNGSTKQDYKLIIKHLRLAMHPDKNPKRREEAEQLFKAFGAILAKVTPHFSKI